jgi:hypothetical protein
MSYMMLIVTGGTPVQFKFEAFAEMHAAARQAIRDKAFKIPGMLLCIGEKTVLVLLSEEGMQAREADVQAAQKIGVMPNRVEVKEEHFVVVVQNGQQELEPMVFGSMESCQRILDDALQQGFIENVFRHEHEHLICVLGPGVLLRAMPGKDFLEVRRQRAVQSMRQQMQAPPGGQPPRIVLPGRR